WIIGTGVYIDDIDKTIARQKEFFYQKMKLLIINVLVASFLLIFFISILRYFVGQYKKRAAVESPSVTEETEETVTTPNTQQQGISVNESLTFAKKISQIILAEQTKLLAYAISIAQSNQTAKSTNKPEIADENVEQLDENVEQLADKVHHRVTNFQEKMVEKIQKFRAY
ncbi:hypothetical protein QUF54_09035, partial [Candidatus Marithioploca araucensis]|nr:hypothetical protein [Candidatus Marithioploca araucensis]